MGIRNIGGWILFNDVKDVCTFFSVKIDHCKLTVLFLYIYGVKLLLRMRLVIIY